MWLPKTNGAYSVAAQSKVGKSEVNVGAERRSDEALSVTFTRSHNWLA